MQMPKIYNVLTFDESRKVSFGTWLFIASNILLYQHLISADQWVLTTMLASTLVGGGTLMDRYLETKKPNVPTPPAS